MMRSSSQTQLRWKSGNWSLPSSQVLSSVWSNTGFVSKVVLAICALLPVYSYWLRYSQMLLFALLDEPLRGEFASPRRTIYPSISPLASEGDDFAIYREDKPA
ncbi:hypothetical protein [Propionivibrio sp.]|uniref:hypothetical protein n=1 Tax=Propionivibrio sp. TaxID=2212460 RepID=UPI003BF09CB2